VTTTPPIALTIAGSDSSGGAGIQADLKTFTALGVYGASVITALTVQNTLGVTGVHPVPPHFVAAQLDAVASDLAVAATKTGMLGDEATVVAVANGISRHRLAPLVVDPVMVATSGDVLLPAGAVEAVQRRLIPLATLLTPNLHEAAKLLDAAPAESLEDMEAQAQALLDLGCGAVLIKGGHGVGAEAVDVLVQRAAPTRHYSARRIATHNTHGTGCTLASAIAAGLAQGLSLEKAVGDAKNYLTAAIAAGSHQKIGRGAGPVDHMHAIRNAGRDKA